ncbi:MAG: hypothetical protein ACLPVY_14230 [Acidimicrobiia bacterium]
MGTVGVELAVVGVPPLDAEVGNDVDDVADEVEVDEFDAETVVVTDVDDVACFELAPHPAATNAQRTMARLALIGRVA